MIIIDAELVDTEVPPPKLLPMAPTSIVCSTCKQETGITKESLLTQLIDDNICCPICYAMIYSCKPEVPTSKWYSSGTSVNSMNAWAEYD